MYVMYVSYLTNSCTQICTFFFHACMLITFFFCTIAQKISVSKYLVFQTVQTKYLTFYIITLLCCLNTPLLKIKTAVFILWRTPISFLFQDNLVSQIKQISSFFCIFFFIFFQFIFFYFFVNNLEFVEKYCSSGLKNVSDCTIRCKTQPRQKTIRSVRDLSEISRGEGEWKQREGHNFLRLQKREES